MAAKNFLCFGQEGVQIYFENYENIVLVKGINLDTGTEIDPASNGTGKSSLQDIVSYCLYGKTVKRPKQLNHGMVVNVISEKGLEVEVQLDDHRIVRNRSPNKLRVWKNKDHVWDDETEITRGTMSETQVLIDGLIGLTHQAFCNVVVFDDSNSYSFLEADTPTKRNVVENVLGLDRYREYNETAKTMLKDGKNNVKNLTIDYEHLNLSLDECVTRIEKLNSQEKTWVNSKQKEIKIVMEEIKEKQKQLEDSDHGEEILKYQEIQDKIEELENDITLKKPKKEKIENLIKEAQSKLELAKETKQEINSRIQEGFLKVKEHKAVYDKCTELITSLEKLEDGQKCSVCRGIIDKSNYKNVLTHEENVIKSTQAKILEEEQIVEQDRQSFGKKSVFIEKLESNIVDAKNKLIKFEADIETTQKEVNNLSRVSKPDQNSCELVLESEITQLKKQLKEKKDEYLNGSPYREIIETAHIEKENKEQQCVSKSQDIKNAEATLPYCEFWVKAFGDSGIRKFVVDGIIPALNTRVSYWLQHLIDNKIELSFDNELNETIVRNGTNAFYHSMSNGEKRRINLAVSQAFSYVMMLNSGNCPSIVFLDEITGGGIDRSGISGIYNMILELAKERQVFITTHNEKLSGMLEGCQEILLKKINDITTLAS
jgi:DNA repair exonuclease SbcCD ATPase subunit